MKFIAKYNVSKDEIEDILSIVKCLNSDKFYTDWYKDFDYDQSSSEEGKIELMDSASLYGTGLKKSGAIEMDLLRSIPFCGWQTCKGNKEFISILDDNNVIYYRSGKRHGIPNHFDHIFEPKNPLKILRYETQSPSQSAFVCGIVPDGGVANKF